MKRLFVTLLLCMFLFDPSVSSAGTSPASPARLDDPVYQSLSWWGEFFRTKVKDVLKDYGGTVAQNNALKSAGASYQKHLTAALPAPEAVSSPHAQAVLSGVFMFDAVYAAVFLKAKDAAAFMEKAQQFSSLAGVTMPMTTGLKKILAEPGRKGGPDAWRSALDESMTRALDAGLENDRQIVLFVDQIYGSIVEGLYITTESIAQSGYSPELMAYADIWHTHLDVLVKLFGIFRDDPAFSALLNLNQRLSKIGEINKVMAFDRMTRQNVDQIRELVAPLRSNILAGRPG
ncbi:MAG: hypothetical protein V6Z89_09290 [Desulfobacter sp.]